MLFISNQICMRFEVLEAVNVMITVFCDMFNMLPISSGYKSVLKIE
jgi:hypothetical protein